MVDIPRLIWAALFGTAGALVLSAYVWACETGHHDASNGAAKKDATIVVTEKPQTIEVKLTDKIRANAIEALSNHSLKVLRLRVNAIEMSEHLGAIQSLRVFIGKPDATAKTSIKDPHYAASIAPNLQKKQSIVVNVAPVIVRLYAAKERVLEKPTIPVTIVPVPVEIKIPIGGIEFELPEKED